MKYMFMRLVVVLLANSSQAAIYYADLSPDNVVPKNDGLSPSGISNASGYALLNFSISSNPTLTYEIHVTGISFLTDVTGVHIHVGHDPNYPFPVTDGIGVNHGAITALNGPHVLNILGMPREDDADLVVDPSGTFITGVWDNSDINLGGDSVYDPSDSLGFGSAIDELLGGNLYIQIHTQAFNLPNTGELRGQIYAVPEPATFLFGALTLASVLLIRRRLRR